MEESEHDTDAKPVAGPGGNLETPTTAGDGVARNGVVGEDASVGNPARGGAGMVGGADSGEDAIVERVAAAIAGDAQVDWSELGLDPSGLAGELENLRRLARVASSFERHAQDREAHGTGSAARDHSGPGAGRGAAVDRDGFDQSDHPAGRARGANASVMRWGPLEILGVLGEGAFGTVHLAFDPMLEREVALKLWKGPADPAESGLEHARQVRRLLEEARRMARVRHPNVLVVYGADVWDGRVGIWSERLQGESLAERLHRVGPLDPEEAARLGLAVADALVAVHAAGVVHGDVKEANVVLEENGRAVLVDFGSSRRIADAISIEPPTSTPYAAAPEVLLDGVEPGTSADLYALGVLLYHLLTGRYPLEAESFEELLQLHRERRSRQSEEGVDPGDHGPESGFLPGVPEPLVEIVRRALEPIVEARFASAAEVARALRIFLEWREDRVKPAALPTAPGRFFGREPELAQLRTRIPSVRLLTLTGVGGAGKSRLALEAIGALHARFPDGIFWVPLAPLRSPEELVPAVLAAIGMSDRADGTAEGLVLRLAAHRLLLVLDNAEHLAEPVRRVAEELVIRTQSVCLVITSRCALGGSYEELFRVGPLAVPGEGELGPTLDEETQGGDPPCLHAAEAPPSLTGPPPAVALPRARSVPPAVALFADRAARRDSGFDLERSRAAVDRICRRLEGLPLAIEIAAARAAALSAEEIAAQLGRILDVAEPGTSGVRRSLRASMEWSAALLPAEVRATFCRLAVFAGGFRSEAAVGVVDRPAFVVHEALATLVEHSLLERFREPEGQTRFAQLETVREFAEEELAGRGELAAAAERHRAYYANYFTNRLPALHGHGFAPVLAELERENANLDRVLASGLARGAEDEAAGRAHVELVLALIRYWSLLGRDGVAQRQVAHAFETEVVRTDPTVRGRLLLASGRFFYLRGFRAAEQDLLAALPLLEGSAPSEHARALASLGSVAVALLRFPEADERIAAAIATHGAIGDEAGLARSRFALADLRFKEGRMDEAEEAVLAAEAWARAAGDVLLLSQCLLVRGSLAWERGDLESSFRIHEECFDITAGAPFLSARVSCHSHLGSLHEARAEHAAARRHFELAERLARHWGEDVRRAAELINLSDYFPLEQRTAVLFEALEILVRFDHSRLGVQTLGVLARHYLRLGRADMGVILAAATARLCGPGGPVLPGPAREELARTVETARAAVSASAFSELAAVGEGLSLAAARDLVRADLLPPGPAGPSPMRLA